MKYFRFFSEGMAPNSRKKYLNPACKNLPTLFSMSDIKPGMFSPYLIKRLASAQHGTRIIVLRIGPWRHAKIGVQAIDKDAHKLNMSRRSKRIRALKKKLKSISNDPDNCVTKYLEHLHLLSKISGDLHLQSACYSILLAKKDWRI
jgi:hypothetical protein